MKPSERIKQIEDTIVANLTGTYSDNILHEIQNRAITLYLDEEYLKANLKEKNV
jgi:protein tyrosine/serine phosphatase